MADTPISNNIAANPNTIPAFIDNVTSQFIVLPPSPTTIGVSGYIFDIIGNETFNLDSDITDSFSETNVSYQDQIALRPEQFTLSGYVGELVNVFPNGLANIITVLASFGIVPNLSPTFNTQDEQFYDQLALVAASVNSIINTAPSIYSLYSNLSTTATKQQNAFKYFYSLWLSRALCQVETPWGVLENMAILNVRARQDETTRIVSDFSITFKAMRFASTSTMNTVVSNLSNNLSSQAQAILSPAQNQGTAQGTPQDSNALSAYEQNMGMSKGT